MSLRLGRCLAAAGLVALACFCKDSNPVSTTPKPEPLTLSAITPNHGPSEGGTRVTITGTGFLPGATVQIGHIPPDLLGTLFEAATEVTVVDHTTITATTATPQSFCLSCLHAAGAFDLVYKYPGTPAVQMAGAYTYECTLAAPTGLRWTTGTSGGNLFLFVLWDAVPTAKSYIFEIGTSPGTTVFSQDPASTNTGTVIGAGTTPPTLTLVKGTSYFFRARAKKSCGAGPVSAEGRLDVG